MSASDAAPLPRLGEVFFDVRGDSRTMRLSWYADTDVAVFSIWQGGKCTGTFRLPMDDLGRMIEILRRGPDRRSERAPGGRGGGERGTADRGPVGNEADYSGGQDADNTVVHVAARRNRSGQYGTEDFSSREVGPPGDYGPGDYGPGDYGPGDYGPGDYGPGDYDPRDRGPGVYGPGDYGPGDYDPRDRGPGDYGPGDYDPPDRGPGDYGPGDYDPRNHGHADYGSSDYGPADYGPGDYGEAGYRDSESRTARHRSERYEPADYGPPDYAEEPPRREYRPDSDYADRTGQRLVPGDEAGYGQQHFEPPYGRPPRDSSERGFPDDPEYRLPADPAGRSRHSAGRHSGGQGH